VGSNFVVSTPHVDENFVFAAKGFCLVKYRNKDVVGEGEAEDSAFVTTERISYPSHKKI
jgi:hypothetical protein